MFKICVFVSWGWIHLALQPNLSSTLYLNIKFILDSKYFQIILKKQTSFLQCKRPHSIDCPNPPVSSCLLLTDHRPPRRRHPSRWLHMIKYKILEDVPCIWGSKMLFIPHFYLLFMNTYLGPNQSLRHHLCFSFI